MATIDERVVEMKFDNRGFADGVRETTSMLDKLKKALKLDGAKQGLAEVDSASKKVNFSAMGEGIANVSAKFGALQVAGVTALANLTNQAVNAGTRIARALTIEPITTGFQEYETQMNAVQTILANTQSKGSTLKDVNGALDELNTYADKTIYNFTEMTRNIGTFTAAGVDLETSTSSIKGIANLAAVSGSNSQQASTAMYQLSQALAAGKVSLMDWNSVVNAGMGGQLFQDALKETARAHGVAVDDIIKKSGSFRASLEEGWITSEVMTDTLTALTGDLSEAQLKEMGYSDKQAKKFMELGKTASDAATKVKTLTQMWDTLKEAVQSGWAKTWQLLFGDFEEAKAMFTGASDALNEIVGRSGEARNKLLGGWKEMGGRTHILDAIKNAFTGIMSIVDTFTAAMREIFPPMTSKQLFNITKGIQEFSKHLKPSQRTLDNLKRTFKGFFALLDIGWEVIKGLAGVFGQLLGSIAPASGGILDFTGNIGDFLVSLRDSIKAGDGLKKFFDGIGKIISVPIKLIGAFGAAVFDAFSGSNFVSALEGRLQGLGAFFDAIVKGAKFAGEAIQFFWDILAHGDFKNDVLGLGEDHAIVDFLFDLREGIISFGKAIGSVFSEGNFSAVNDIVNTGLFATLAISVKKFLDFVKDLKEEGEGGGLKDSINEIFDSLNGCLSSLQANIQAGTLMKIAGALGILTLSILALSLIDSDKLGRSLVAITIMFGQLAGAMALLDHVTSAGSAVKLTVMAVGLSALAVAINILAIAVRQLSGLGWNELAQGLVGVSVALAAMVIATNSMANNSGNLIRAGLGMIAISVAVRLLANAVTAFATMDMASMAQGLIGVGVALASLALFSNAVSQSGFGPGQGLAILILAGALNALGMAVATFGSMNLPVLVQGLISMAVALGMIAGAMAIMPANMGVTALSLIAISGALLILSGALNAMGGMSWEEVARGLVTLAVSLGLIAGAMQLMATALPGAAALIVVAAAISMLVPPLIMLSMLSWGAVITGLATLAGVFAVVGVAGLLLAPLVPVLVAMAVAIGALGIAVLAAGAGVMLFASGLTALGAAGAVGAAGISAFVMGVLGLLPQMVSVLAATLIGIATAIAAAAPAIINAMVVVLQGLLNAVVTLSPSIGAAIQALVNLLIQIMVNNIPALVNAGLTMLVSILRGIDANMQQVVSTAVSIIAHFLDGIASKLPQITDSGANLIISFVNSMANTIRGRSGEMSSAGINLAGAIIDGMVQGLKQGVNAVAQAAKDVAGGALNGAKDFLGIHSPSREFFKLGGYSSEGFANGMTALVSKVTKASTMVGKKAMNSLKDAVSRAGDAVTTDISSQPRIRPVLDLSDIRNGARTIGESLSGATVDVRPSYGRAMSAAPSFGASSGSINTDATKGMTFIQNNYSPKALSRVEIYRQTRSQLAMAREAG